MAEWRPTLGGDPEAYGVPASIVVAIWGRETGFGKIDAPYDALAGHRHARLHGAEAR